MTNGTSAGNFGLLRDGRPLRWPVALRSSDYQGERWKVDKLAARAFKEAQKSEVHADTNGAMSKAVNPLYADLKSNIRSTSVNDYIRAKRYLGELDKTIRILDDPNLGNYASRRWSATGYDVRDLVTNMTQQGLQFAPVTTGDEAAYTSLHSSMVTYYTQQGGPYQRWDPGAK